MPPSSVVALYPTHHAAELAVEALREGGYDMKSLSIVGRDHDAGDQVVGYYDAGGDRAKVWSRSGAFWSGIWGLLFGSAFLWVPTVGPLLLAGPVVGWVVVALESAAVVGGVSAVGAGLYGIGIPKDSIVRYEAALRDGSYVVVAHGRHEDTLRAREILGHTSPEAIDHHVHAPRA